MSPSIRHGSSQDAYVNAVVYIPYRQDAPAAASLLMRSALPPASIVEAVRREVQAVDPDQPVRAMRTLPQILAADRWWYRSFGGMFGIFAVIALVLSSVGVYAVMAYSVTQRTQEIGVRMAVGAQGWQVWWMILRRGRSARDRPVVRPRRGAGHGRHVRADDGRDEPRLSDDIRAVTILAIVALAACFVPALTATRVDPAVALRAD